MVSIVLDVDDVLIDFVGPLVPYIKDRFPELWDSHTRLTGQELTRDLFHTYSVEKVVGCSTDMAKEVIFDFYYSPGFIDLPPVNGARESLVSLAQDGYEFNIATSRPDTLREITRGALERHFPVKFNEFHFSGGQIVSNSNRTKGKICYDLKASVLVDDAPKYTESCLEEGNGTKPILFHTPWNKDFQHPQIRRAMDWSQTLEIIRSINGNH